MTKRSTQKVAIALSGGVDSAVAAFLLLRQGYNVEGVFMKTYEPESSFTSGCHWQEDQSMAEQIAKQLGIPFQTWNFERLYEKNVLEPFYRGLERGKTPNPDVDCNKQIKFGIFLKRALSQGFDRIATGHYASLSHAHGHVYLQKPIDRMKDQTYFLSSLTERQLKNVLFPLQNYTKNQVRKIASKNKFINANRPDSQGICFVGEVPMRHFLADKIKMRKGPILTVDGKRIGTHQGLPLYTIGQREGLRIGGLRSPLYVVAKNTRANALVVDTADTKTSRLFSHTIYITTPHWITGPRKLPFPCSVAFRYRQKPQKATLLLRNKKIIILPKAPQRAVTPGQVAVFYDKKLCLGNALITKAV